MRFNPDAKLDPSQIDDRRDERNPIMTPTARPTNALAIAADAQGRMARGFRRWSPGILGGRTEVASPARPGLKGALVPRTLEAPTSAAGGPHVAWLNNSEGGVYTESGNDWQQWNQLATVGATDWFEFPTEYWGSGPEARAAFRFMQPGIFTVIARVTGSGLTSVEVTAGGAGQLALRGVGDVADSLCGSGMFIAEQVEAEDYEVLLIETSGADPAFSSVAIAFWPGEPVITSF